MCEILVVCWPRPEPLERILPWALEIERLGVAGFGWGLAWDDGAGGVGIHKRPTRLSDDAGAGWTGPASIRSRRFLVHLRRPSKLSTVDAADTQPFGADRGGYAFCHNGFLPRHDTHRAALGDRLHGRADSEVGFLLLDDLLADGRPPDEALREVHARLGGEANFGFLPADGPLLMYAVNRRNRLWRFDFDGAEVAATGLHSADDSLFDLVFPTATARRLVSGVTAMA